MSTTSFPKNVVDKKEVVKKIVLGMGYKFDEEISNTLFFLDSNDLIFGVSVGSGKDHFMSVHFAMAIDEPVDAAKRLAAVNFVSSEYKILKCYYRDISLVLASEFFADLEEVFAEYFRYTVAAILKAYSELEEKHSGAL